MYIIPLESYEQNTHKREICSILMHLIFDTETTGMPTSWSAPITDSQAWPRMVQLAYQLCDDKGNVLKEVNHIVYPDGYSIPIASTRIHGISTKKAIEEGAPLNYVLFEFLEDLDKATHVIAHNADFDTRIVDSELVRLNKEPILTEMSCICTMKGSVEVCKIPSRRGYKWPKLEELHQYLFDETFEGAHNALIDVQATSRCYFELRAQNHL